MTDHTAAPVPQSVLHGPLPGAMEAAAAPPSKSEPNSGGVAYTATTSAPHEPPLPASTPLSEHTYLETSLIGSEPELPRLITLTHDPDETDVARLSDGASNTMSLPELADFAAPGEAPPARELAVAASAPPKALPRVLWNSLTRSALETASSVSADPKPVLRHTTRQQTGVFRSRAQRFEHKVIGLGEYGLDATMLDARQQELAEEEEEERSHHRSSEGSSFALRGRHEPRRTVEQMEEEARAGVASNPWYLLWAGNMAALKVMGFYLITLETILACVLTAGFTCYWYFAYRGDPKWNGGGLDFILLAFTVTTPIATALGMAFTRRERALIALGEFRSCSHHLFLSHCLWDWIENGGRAAAAKNGVDWVEHVDAVMAQLIGIGDELSRFLTLPTVSRSRHRMTAEGRKEARLTMEAAYYLIDSIETQRITRLVLYSERLKKIGLPSGELSRVRQYERFISVAVEQLRLVKMYRTPQALRSFARIFTVLLPPFYAPSFAQVARDTGSLGMGICFGIIACLCLTSLFESLQVLEDPFTAFLALDGIDVREELEVLHFAQLLNTRQIAFPDAPPFPAGRRAALIAMTDPGSLKKLHHLVGLPPVQTHHGAHKRKPSAANLNLFSELDVPDPITEEAFAGHEDLELGTPLFPGADGARFNREPLFSDDDATVYTAPHRRGHFRSTSNASDAMSRGALSLSQRLARRALRSQHGPKMES